MRNASAVAIAGGAVSAALIDWMIKSNFITPDAARTILTNALTRLRPFERMLRTGAGPAANVIPTPDVIEAERIIGELFGGIS
jgi:hypothetical protein